MVVVSLGIQETKAGREDVCLKGKGGGGCRGEKTKKTRG